MQRLRLSTLLLLALLVAGPLLSHPAQAASLVEITNFGPNPGALRMHLYVPDSVAARPAILVALHYCGGNGPGFYSGTEFAGLADRYGFIVIYPSATRFSNCFDYSSPEALRHDGGSDPVSIVSMVQYVIQQRSGDSSRVYVVGSSSGAIETNVLLGTNPDVFKAGAAFMGAPFACLAGLGNTPSANVCSQGQLIKTPQEWGNLVRAAYPGYTGPRPPMQVWHGTNDNVLNYALFGEQIKQWTNVHGVSQTPTTTDTPQSGWTHTRYLDSSGKLVVEGYSLQGYGHNLPQPGMAAQVIRFFGLDGTQVPPTATPPPPTRTSTTTSTIPPPPTRTSTAQPPTRTSTTQSTAQPTPNMLRNGSFETDADGNGRPDSWTGSNSVAAGAYTRSNAMKYGASGTYSIRHSSTGNVSYMVTQVVGGLQPGQSYRVGGWTNIPATGDTFSYRLELVWRNASNQSIGTQLIRGYTAATSGWSFGGGDYTAPAGTANAVVRMNVGDLNATIYSDVFTFRPAVAPSPTTGVATATTPPTATIPPTATRTATPAPASALRINAGSTTALTDSAGNIWEADTGFSGGSTYSTSNAVDTSQLSEVVPPQVFQTERYGEFTYTIPNLPVGSAQIVTLYFAETYWTAAGQRTFNVLINGAAALADFDIFAAAGANRGIARSFNTTANASGQVVIQFSRGAGPDNPKINGIAVSAGGSGASYTLTVSKAGSGTVTSAPAGISCGATCSASYASGTSVTLTAVPASGATFGGWGGACSGSGACVVSMDQARLVTATFSGGSRPSAGCGRTRTLQNGTHTIQSGGVSRSYILWVPSTYTNSTPYRLVFGYHWLGGSATDVATGRTVQTDVWAYYGLQRRANNTTIFIAPQGIDNGWANTNDRDLALTDAILAQVQNDLCIDQSRIFATGFSYGGAMSYAVACARPNVFRAVAVLAGGVLSGCSGGTGPIAYLGVHGIGDTVLNISGGRSMRDRFVRNNGYALQNPPEPAAGSRTHICTKYQGGQAAYPVEWCAFDGGHIAAPQDGTTSDSGNSWVPAETWAFFSQF